MDGAGPASTESLAWRKASTASDQPAHKAPDAAEETAHETCDACEQSADGPAKSPKNAHGGGNPPHSRATNAGDPS